MTYTFKLSRRLAASRTALLLVLPIAAPLACGSGEPLTSASPSVALSLAPHNANVAVNQSTHFVAYTHSGADSTPAAVSWSASGGTITNDGAFSATDPGTYHVRGRNGEGQSDSAVVVVNAPPSNPGGGGPPPPGGGGTPPSGPATYQTFSFHNSTLNDTRTVHVYLPPGYAADATRRYAVLYMQDGQYAFINGAVTPAASWMVDSTASTMIRAGTMAPIIVVALDATGNRTIDYSPQTPGLPTGRGLQYTQMLIDELKPTIDQKYRTLTDAAHTGIAGSSLGGSISAYAMALRPDVFGRSAPLSAGINNPNSIALTTLQKHSPSPVIRMYWSRGTLDTSPTNQQDDQTLIVALKAMGYVDGRDFKYELIAGAHHDVLNWRARVPTFLAFLFPANGS